MFHQCVRWFGTEFHFTRLDIAIDDRNEVPFFTPAQIRKKFEKEEFVSTSDFYHFDDSKYDTDDLARTAYLGSGKSPYLTASTIRTERVSAKYNKSLDEIGSWKRTEIQLRDEKAHAFACSLRKDLWSWESLRSVCWRKICALSFQQEREQQEPLENVPFLETLFRERRTFEAPYPQNTELASGNQQWLTDGGVISAVKGFYFLEEHDALGELKSVGKCWTRQGTALHSPAS